jgi:hypothetical protein
MTEFTSKIVGGHILHVPPAHVIHNIRPVGVCQIPVNADGDLCLEPTYSEEARRQHAAKCAQENATAINAFRNRQHPEVMRPWDPELEEFVMRRRVDILTGREPMPNG